MLLVTAPPWRIPLRKDLLTQRWGSGTCVQTSGNFMSKSPWTGCGGSRWPTPRGSQHHHFGESTVYETRLHLASGTCSSNGALLTEKALGSARSESYCPFCSKGWSEGCLPPPLKSMRLRLLPTTTPWMGSWWGSMTGSIRFLRGARRLNPPRPPSIPSWDLSLVLRALQQGPFEPCKQSSWSFSQWKLYSCLH